MNILETLLGEDFSDIITNFTAKSVLVIMTAFVAGEFYASYFSQNTFYFFLPLLLLAAIIMFTSLEDLISLKWIEFIQEPITLILMIVFGSFVFGQFFWVHFKGTEFVFWPIYLYLAVLLIRLVRELFKKKD